MSKLVSKENLQEFATKLHAKNKSLYALKSQMGTPTVVTTAASMTDQTKIYVYMGTETGYIKGGWYYYSGPAWTFGGMYNSGDWIGDDLKQALLQLASKVAYIDDDGQDYYDALESALYHDATLVSISAVYTQSGTVYDTDSLDGLKADLVVTATYDDSTTATVTTYTLSGTLEVGTSTITVAYGGKTTTFNVTVTYGWNVDWATSDGDPLNLGFSSTTVQTGSAVYNSSTGFELKVGGSGGSADIKMSTVPSYTSGLVEYEFNISQMPTIYQGIILFFTNGTDGNRIRIYDSKIYYGASANTQATDVQIGTISTGNNYTLSVQWSSTEVSVYLNNSLLTTTTIQQSGVADFRLAVTSKSTDVFLTGFRLKEL